MKSGSAIRSVGGKGILEVVIIGKFVTSINAPISCKQGHAGFAVDKPNKILIHVICIEQDETYHFSIREFGSHEWFTNLATEPLVASKIMFWSNNIK